MHQCMQQDIKTLDVNILASPKETIIYSFIRSFIINQVAWSTSEQNTMKHPHTHKHQLTVSHRYHAKLRRQCYDWLTTCVKKQHDSSIVLS